MAKSKGAKAADDAAPETAPAEAKAGGGILGLALLAVGAIASSFATVYFLSPEPVAEVAVCEADESATHTESVIKPNQSYVELRDILITIGGAPATRYLKMKVAIITDSGDISTVNEAEPVLIDAFTNYLRSVELSDFENPGFYSHMRDQLDRRSQLVLGGSVSDGVLITEFLLR
ncbi:flagellar basal body-associated protein FliL [Hyphomonas sp.]|jgi:flagellar basal body-associated protein FliL|uniref:flagellar basal body-associated FliL family protein n=1 Tax=Hyphomonas sp. TaxID=87 RepID=UPI00356991E5